MTSSSADAVLPYCLNCHYTLSVPRPRHCGNCGQETDLHPPSLGEFVHEFVGHYVALEGALWRTLWALFFLPGRLTLEYFHGRRRRYVLPLRVYLSASFVFFVGFFTTGGSLDAIDRSRPIFTTAQDADAPAARSSSASAASAPASATSIDIKVNCDAPGQRCGWVEQQIARFGKRADTMTRGQIGARMKALAPYAMLAMQPIYALLLWLMFAGSGRRYAEHFVFSLHMHAFWFLALLLDHWIDTSLAVPLVFAHGLIALRRVYDHGWFGAGWRAVLLSTLYVLLLALAAATLAVIATFSA